MISSLGLLVASLIDLDEEVTAKHVITDVGVDGLDATGHRGCDDGLHLHGTEHEEGSTGLDDLALLDADIEDNTGHGSANGTGHVGHSLGALGGGNTCLLVKHADDTLATVHLKDDVALAILLADATDSNELDVYGLTVLELNGDLLVNLKTSQEGVGIEDLHVTKLRLELHEAIKDIRVESVGHDVELADLISSVLGLELLLSSLKVVWLHLSTRAGLEHGLAVREGFSLEHAGAEGLRETVVRDTEVALEVFDDGLGEGESLSLLNNLLSGEVVLDDELGKVTDNLGGRRHLDDVSEEVVGGGVSLLDGGPLASKTELLGLVHQVGVLATRHLMEVDIGGTRHLTRLEGSIDSTNGLPVLIDRNDFFNVDTGVKLSALEGVDDGTHGRLRGSSRHGIGGTVNSICSSVSTLKHGGDSSTGSVVGVDVNGEVRELLADGTNKDLSSLGLEETSHILNGKNVDALIHKLADKVQVVLKVVLAASGVRDISGVADDGLNDTAGRSDSVNSKTHVLKVVERVEDTEDIHTGALGLLTELEDHVIRVAGVSNGVGATEKHLEWDVRHLLTEAGKTLPGVLTEESHGDIKGGTTPHLDGVGVAHGNGCGRCNGLKVLGANTGGEQGLVSIAPSGVSEKKTLVLADGLGKGLSAILDVDLTQRALVGGLRSVENGHNRSDIGGCRAGGAEGLFRAVDDGVTNVLEKALATVVRTAGLDKVGVLSNKAGVNVAGNEVGVVEHVCEEALVGGNTTNTELGKSALQLVGTVVTVQGTSSELDEQRVVVRSDVSVDETGAIINTDTHATRAAEDLDDAGVRLESSGGILSGDTALHGVTTDGDVLLLEAKVLESLTASNANLALDKVNSSDLLSDGVLDLDTRVDLNEVVASEFVHKELNGTGVLVLGGSGETDSIVNHSLLDSRVKANGGGGLEDLLVTALDRAVTVVKVNDVTLAVTENLHLDVARAVDVALDEDSTIAEGRQRLRTGTLEVLLELISGVDNAHSAATTTHAGLDDDGVSDTVIDEGLGLFEGGHRSRGTRHNGDVVLNGDLASCSLVSEAGKVLGCGSDKGDAVGSALFGESYVLREETISGVDSVDLVVLGNLDDRRDVEVGSDGGLALTDLERLISLVAVLCEAVLA